MRQVIPTPQDLASRVASEIGIANHVTPEQTWQPFISRQDQLRKMLDAAYQQGAHDALMASLPAVRDCCDTFEGSHHRDTCPKYRGKFARSQPAQVPQ